MMLGNLSVKEIESRLGIELTNEEREILKGSKQDMASDIAKDKWHCFDIPFFMACGSYDMAVKVKDILSPYEKQIKIPIQVGMIDNG